MNEKLSNIQRWARSRFYRHCCTSQTPVPNWERLQRAALQFDPVPGAQRGDRQGSPEGAGHVPRGVGSPGEVVVHHWYPSVSLKLTEN